MKSQKVFHIISELNPYGGTIKKILAWMKHSRHRHLFGLYRISAIVSRDDCDNLNLCSIDGNFFKQLALCIHIVNAKEVDVLVGHYFRGSVLAFLTGLFTRQPVVIILHGPAMHFPSIKKRLYILLLKLADTVVYNSNFTANSFNRTGDYRVIYNSVDDREVGVKCCFLGDCRSIKLLSIGGLSKTKNYDLLIRALQYLDERYVLTIIGDGPEFENLQNRATSLGVQGRVSLLGYRESAHRYLQSYDVFLHPSIVESFGVTVLEALLARIPVVVAECCATFEVVNGGEYGWVAPHGDAFAWAQKIQFICDHPVEAWEKCVLGREWALSRFSIELFSSALDALVLDVANRSPKKS